MAIAVSTIPAAKKYLFQALQQRAELAAPVVLFYDVLGKRIPDDWVKVGDVRRKVTVARMVGSGGTGWLDERYTITVTVASFRGGDNPETVFERAAALMDVVVDVVRQDPSLGGLVIQANPLEAEYRSDWAESNLGRVTEIVQPIEVFATI